EFADFRDLKAPLTPIGTVATQRPVGVSQRWRFDHAGQRFALVLQADEGAPDRNAAEEVARAVNRIDDPAKSRRAGRLAGCLAQQAIGPLGIGLREWYSRRVPVVNLAGVAAVVVNTAE